MLLTRESIIWSGNEQIVADEIQSINEGVIQLVYAQNLCTQRSNVSQIEAHR
jgi:hypothetical protein